MNVEKTSLAFDSIYHAELDRILEPLSTKIFIPAKKIICEPGDPMDFIYYIKSGTTKHYMSNSDGLEKILYSLNAGWLFGEAAFAAGVFTGLHSIADTDVELYKIPSDVCNMLIDTNKLFRDTLFKCYSFKILTLRYEIENITFHSCKSRLKRLFCSSVDKENITDPGWYNLRVKYTQQELGVIVGAARVTVTKLVNELCQEGFMRMINRRVQVNISKYEEHLASCYNTDRLL